MVHTRRIQNKIRKLLLFLKNKQVFSFFYHQHIYTWVGPISPRACERSTTILQIYPIQLGFLSLSLSLSCFLKFGFSLIDSLILISSRLVWSVILSFPSRSSGNSKNSKKNICHFPRTKFGQARGPSCRFRDLWRKYLSTHNRDFGYLRLSHVRMNLCGA